MIWILSIVIIVCLLASGLLILVIPIDKKALKLILAFSGAFLLTVTLVNILPEVYGSGQLEPIHAGSLVLLGFFLQIILEFFSKGIEHGHFHVHADTSNWKAIVPMSASLFIHSFLEGIPLSNVQSLTNPLFLGILLHNVPIAIAYTTLLSHLKFKRSTIFILLGVFACMTPLGLLAGKSLHALSYFNDIHTIALAITIGIFLHISTTIIFETSEQHRFHFKKFVAILLGVALAMLPHLIGHQHS